MKRREFIAGAGAAMAPLAGRAQGALPVVGFVSGRTLATSSANIAAFRKGLAEAGYVEGANVVVDYRWAEGSYDLQPGMIAELVRRPVSVICVFNVDSALAAKQATATLPIVFAMSADPVKSGLVASLARPGGNLTGATFLNSQLVSKQFEVLHELAPAPATMAMLVNPTNSNTDLMIADARAAASILRRDLAVFRASAVGEIDEAFASIAQRRIGALLLSADPFFDTRSAQLVALSATHALPTVYSLREHVQVGGLASYGSSITDAYRVAGAYAGRILKGEKPANLPVQQGTKVELTLNLKTAKALGLNLPLTILGRADEVIE